MWSSIDLSLLEASQSGQLVGTNASWNVLKPATSLDYKEGWFTSPLLYIVRLCVFTEIFIELPNICHLRIFLTATDAFLYSHLLRNTCLDQ